MKDRLPRKEKKRIKHDFLDDHLHAIITGKFYFHRMKTKKIIMSITKIFFASGKGIPGESIHGTYKAQKN